MRKIVLVFSLLFVVLAGQAQELNLYVSPTGDDAAEGTPAAPLRSIGRALELANDSATHIFVASGNYSENRILELRSNLIMEGGLDESTWRPSTSPTLVTINNTEQIDTYSHKIGLRSQNDTNWLIQRLTVTVASATDSDRAPSGKGATVYVLHVSGNAAGNRILDCHLMAGDGGDGINGTNGTAGSSGSNGGSGGSGGLSPLTNSGTEVGTGGSAAGSGVRAGGRGGNGGAGGEGNGNNGNSGNSGLTGGNGAGGNGGNGGGTTSPGHNGDAGTAGTNGANGITVVSGNTYEWLHYFVPAATGNAGTDGLGGGGGGGGAGGGSATGTTLMIPNQYCGGAGGGGGAGGEGGTGGAAGTAGGGSFGIYCADGQSPFIHNTVIDCGTAGQGGMGGIGGTGGQGGNGGSGGSCSVTGTAGRGGNGGNGGRGGNGGDGENGCNGAALRVAVVSNGQLAAENIATPYTYETYVCGGDGVVLTAIPGFGGQTCQWFAEGNDSIPLATDTVLVLGEATEETYYVFTYDTVRDARSFEHVTITVLPSYYEHETVELLSSDLPYSYGDTVFEEGTVSSEYLFHHTTAAGCDSITALELTIVPNDTANVTTWGQEPMRLTVFPNPATEQVTVRYEAGTTAATVGLYSGDGRLVQTMALRNGEATMDLSGLARGTYFVKVMETPSTGTSSARTQMDTRKIIVQ